MSVLLCSGAILGVRIAFWMDNPHRKQGGKKEIKEGQMTLRWRQDEGEHRKKWLTPVTGQFGKGSVHMDLKYL